MAWRIELSSLARKNLRDLDVQAKRRVLTFLNERLARVDDPRSMGDVLRGSKLGAFWKYRVGDFRIIADIRDEALLILLVRIGNRRDVCR